MVVLEESRRKEVLEWNTYKKWNPFNSYKMLTHVKRWEKIRRGRPVPPPGLITVDPTNVCNFNCAWCNAAFIREHRKGHLSEKMLLDLADFLPKWGYADFKGDFKVDAVCIAGGGEPLLNSATASFIDKLCYNDVEVGMVTNGSKINHNVDALSQCVWVGVSVDAGCSSTFNKLKGLPDGSKMFDRVTNNISILVDYAKRHNAKLGYTHPAYGVSYKFLLYKDNIGEVYEAAKLAKEIGCKNIHFRPAGTPWDKLGTDEEISFSDDDIELFNEQIAKALELDDYNFSVYGITHKFDSQFKCANYFKMCYAVFMTALIMPPYNGLTSDADAFTVGLCCDRRGDSKLELASNITDVTKIDQLWGSKVHWDIHDDVQVHVECPRCTYQPHNEIYEQVILNDSMTYKFI